MKLNDGTMGEERSKSTVRHMGAEYEDKTDRRTETEKGREISQNRRAKSSSGRGDGLTDEIRL